MTLNKEQQAAQRRGEVGRLGERIGPVEKCLECGVRVMMPCLACELRKKKKEGTLQKVFNLDLMELTETEEELSQGKSKTRQTKRLW